MLSKKNRWRRSLTSRRKLLRRVPVVVFIGVALCILTAIALVQRALDRWLATTLPTVPDLSIYAVLYDQTRVAVTITEAWQKVQLTVAAETLGSDVTFWRKMNFDDWDKVPSGLREDALHEMWKRYEGLIRNPSRWDRMDAHDWDLIPQPIRAMAYIQMMKYWTGYYQAGASYGLPRATVTNTMSALIMAESWFEHRGSYTSPDGQRDIGLGGSSDYCRQTLARLYQEGAIDFTLREEDYFNPWQATRVIAVWFQLMLQETDGDLDAAVRAYHRGSPLARLGEGEAYLTNVKLKRRRFMRNENSTPTWDFFFVRAAELERVQPTKSFTAGRPKGT